METTINTADEIFAGASFLAGIREEKTVVGMGPKPVSGGMSGYPWRTKNIYLRIAAGDPGPDFGRCPHERDV